MIKYHTVILLSLLVTTSSSPTQQTSTTTNISHDKGIDHIINEIELHGISFIDFVFTDLHGALYEITLPTNRALNALLYGLKFDGSSVVGCSSINHSDMHLTPELETFKILAFPHNGSKTARLMCHVCCSETEPYQEHPREILKQAMKEMHRHGYQLQVGAELEFFLFNAENNSFVPCDTNGYCQADDQLQSWVNKKTLMLLLLEHGIQAEKIHHEVAQGQHEIVIHHGDPLTVADQLVEAKHYIKLLANQMGLVATFMPKPRAYANGSAMHIHFSVSDITKGVNLFYNADDDCLLSSFAKQYIAGVLHHAYEGTLFLNPTINSYKRLVPGYEAPIYICWGNKNRSSLIRIPTTNRNQPEATRAEIRSPDPSSNPYLVFAFLIYAGLEGVKNQETLESATTENLYQLSEEQINYLGIHMLPNSLQKAVNASKQSGFIRKYFGDQFIDKFLELKQAEINTFQYAITDWELEHYL